MLGLSLLGIVCATRIRGVNLGGWLVMEPWITPKLFESANDGVPRIDTQWGPGGFAVHDEYTWRAAPPGSANRSDLLVQHWDTWVTEDLVDQLHAAGITHLRVPVGYWYWNFSATEPFGETASIHPLALNALKTMANSWAKPRGMQVLIDLHTAPGSQNGFDNSGRRGDVNFTQPQNLAHWAAALDTMAGWMVENIDPEVLFGIEILNEPAGFYDQIWDVIKSYVNPNGYAAVRRHSKELNVIFETGFKAFAEEPLYPEPQWHNVWFDQHTYQAFGDYWNDLAVAGDGWQTHLTYSCDQAQEYSTPTNFAFAGEWSLATTDCTIYLAGGMNANCNLAAHPDCKYNATPTQHGNDGVCQYYNSPASEFSPQYKEFLANYARAQMDSFEHASGWFFWNFRTEGGHAPEWDYLLGWHEGWMPKSAGGREPYCPQMSKPSTTNVFV